MTTISTPRPRGVGKVGSITAKLGSNGRANGLPNVSSVPKKQPPVQTLVGSQMSVGEQERPNLRGSNFIDKRKMQIARQGFKKNQNMKPKPNALYGEI